MLSYPGKNRRKTRKLQRKRLGLFEPLEDRRLLTPFPASFGGEVPSDNPLYPFTLRGAIEAANNKPGPDEVILAANNYAITSPLKISDDLVLKGTQSITGASNHTISGNGSSRIIEVDDGDINTRINVEIVGITITGGRSIGDAYLGAGIFSFDNLTLRNVIVSGNHATGKGGGLTQWEGTLNVINSLFSGNSAGDQGGAIYIQGSNTIANIIDSTISGNTANGNGGGISVFQGTTIIRNATITGNRADSDKSGFGSGGGLWINQLTNTKLHNTIVIGNFLGTEESDISGAVKPESSYNLVGDSGAAGGLVDDPRDGTGDKKGNIVTSLPADFFLDPVLADNGGGIPTHQLVGSRAIDAGNNDEAIDNNGALITDQRFFPAEAYPRIRNGNADNVATVDIGAYESTLRNPTVTSSADGPDDGDYSFGNLTLREAIAQANLTRERDSIRFADSLIGQPITLTQGELRITADTEIEGSRAENTIIDAGGNSRVFRIENAGVTLRDLAITGGDASKSTDSDPTFDALGGGVLNEEGYLKLDSVRVHGNSAQYGGGINNWRGTVEIMHSSIDNNTATQEEGAGLYNWGDGGSAKAIVWNSTIANNKGSGVYNWSGTESARLEATNVTVTANTSSGVDNVNGEVIAKNVLSVGNGHAGFTGTPLHADSANNLTDGDTTKILSSTPIMVSGMPVYELVPGSPAIDAGGEHPVPIPGLYNTGVDDAHKPLPPGVSDPHYSMLSGSIFNATIAQDIPGWVANSETSRWIGPYVPTGDGSVTGTLAFHQSLIVSPFEFDPNTVHITGKWAADNSGKLVANFVPRPEAAANGFQSLKDFQFSGATSRSSGSILRQIILRFEINNTGGPGGLRVEDLSGTAIPALDQLQVSRISDGDLDGTARIDIGAVEAPRPSRIIVTTTDDQVNKPGTSLREAISIANSNGLDDMIDLPAGTYKLTRTGTADGNNLFGDLDFFADNGKRIRLFGDGVGKTIIDATDLSERAFHVLADALVTIEDVTIMGGFAQGNQSLGGGIHNVGDLTLNRVQLEMNSAVSGGGAIFNRGNLTVSESTITNNTSATGLGGGILNQPLGDEAPTLVVRSSTLDHNRSLNGGAIVNFNSYAEILNTTLSTNTSQNQGAALLNVGSVAGNTALVILSNVTVARNNGSAGAVHASSQNNGVSNVRTANSIFIDNKSTNPDTLPNSAFTNLTQGSPDNSSGMSVVSLGTNIASGDGFNFLTATGDQANISVPVIEAAPKDNGRPTLTHALVANSPAIDRGNKSLAASPGSDRILGGGDDQPFVANFGESPKRYIRPIEATSSTATTDAFPSSFLINTSFPDDEYLTQLDSNGWSTDAPNGGKGNDYFANETADPVLTFQLDRLTTLTDIVIRGYRFGQNNDVKTLLVELSSNGGRDYFKQILLTKPRVDREPISTLSLGGEFPADTIRLTITDNYFGEEGNDGGDRVGLYEVGFLSPNDSFRTINDGNGDGTMTVDIGAAESPPPSSYVALPSGETRVTNENGTIFVRNNGLILFQDARANVTKLNFFGGPLDATLSVGDLKLQDDKEVELTFDGQGGNDTLRLIDAAQTLDLTQAPAGAFTGIETIDISGTGANQLNFSAANMRSASSASPVLLRLGLGDRLSVSSGWKITSHQIVANEVVRTGTFGNSEITVQFVSAAPWQNALNPLDTDGNGTVEPIDALLLINELNARNLIDEQGNLPDPAAAESIATTFLDTSGDNSLEPLDVLLIINHLNTGVVEIAPGIQISKTTATVSESDAISGTFSDSFTVALTAKPSANVVIEFVAIAPSAAILSQLGAVFTPENWNVPQEIKLLGLNDDEKDGDQTTKIRIRVFSTTDALEYFLAPDQELSVVTLDDD